MIEKRCSCGKMHVARLGCAFCDPIVTTPLYRIGIWRHAVESYKVDDQCFVVDIPLCDDHRAMIQEKIELAISS